MTSLRYSRPKFRVTLTVAAAMTVMISGTAWMLMSAFHVRHADIYALASAAIFFAFVSAAMLFRYLRGEIVLAVRPTGLFDARWQADTVPWENIREIVMRRREDEVELDVYLWHRQRPANARRSSREAPAPDHIIELAPLDADAEEVAREIAGHATLRVEGPTGRRRIEKVAGVEG